jgi:trk system potassium uptake protein
MEILIIGAGTIGYSIAKTLSKNHAVTVIEDDEERYDYIVENLDVGALNANGASPKVLKGAINEKTDIVMAVTAHDEINIFACMVAKQIKKDVVTVARVRNSEYIDPEIPSGFMAVDHMISPEHLIADMMFKVPTTENMIDYEELKGLGAEMCKFSVKEGARAITTIPFSELPLPAGCKVVVIHRGKEAIMPRPTDFLLVGDEVTVVGTGKALTEFDKMLGHVRCPKDFIIVGGGIVGEILAKKLEVEKASVKLIENDDRRCERLSKSLDRTIIINDDGSDPAVLHNENVSMVDALISVGDNEEENLLACLIGRHLGAPKVISLYTRRDYEDVFGMKEIDAAFGYYHVVTNEILKLTAPGFKVMLSMSGFSEEFFSVAIGEKCKLRDKAIRDIELPERSIIAMVQRAGETLYPVPDTVLKEGDLLLIYAAIADISRLERMFHAQIPVGP